MSEVQIGTQIHVEEVIKICFQAVVLEKTLESPLCSKEIKSIILKEIKPEYSLEGLMLKLKLLYFGYLMWRAISLEKNPNARKDWGQEEKGITEDKNGWMASPTRWTWVWANSRRQWRTGMPGVLQSMGLQRVGHDWATERQHREWAGIGRTVGRRRWGWEYASYVVCESS